MITISTYQLRDYPCIYYLSKMASIDIQRDFLCGLGSIFNLDAAAISASSILFAHISKGVLYEKTGFTIEDIEQTITSAQKTYRDCKSLNKSNLAKKYNLPSNCCKICPLSHTYANDRIDIERKCLRYTIDTGKLVSLQSMCFTSIISISPGNDISNYPLIPFNKILNEYFNENDPHEPYDMKELISSFSKYLFSKLNLNTNAFDGVLACVEREIGQLYSGAYANIKEAEVSLYHTSLLSPYKYTPPKFLRSEDNQKTPKSKRPSKIEYEEIPDLKSLFDSPSMKQGTEQDVTEKNTVNESFTNDKGVSDDISLFKHNLNHSPGYIDSYVEEPRLDLDLVNKVISNETVLDVKTVNDTIKTITSEPHEDVSCSSILYPEYNVSNSFVHEICDCTTDDAKSVLQFITNTCSSSIMCVESVVLNSKHGLLFMTTSPIRYYFFDIKNASSGYLYPALSDAYKLKFLSLNPLPVISMLSNLGFNEISIESLTGMYCIVHGISNIYDYGDVFDNSLSISNDGNMDFYQFYMPFYEELYRILMSNLSSLENKCLIEKYRNGIKLNNALGHYYDLSEIFYNQKTAISGTGFSDYKLEVTADSPIIKEGIMYTVKVNNLAKEDPKTASQYFEDVCIGVFLSPIKCIRFSKLISITQTSITYYAIADGDVFFDVLLDIIRRKYKKYYKDIPILQTYRTEYR